MEEMIFSAVTQEFTTSPDIHLDSGLKQTWKFLINVPMFLLKGTVSRSLKGGTIHVSPYNLMSDEEPECTKNITVSADQQFSKQSEAEAQP